ncbi:MAG: LamG domain-containing protein [Planctomycetes bacterium]|nr:LamG domain-containing protein [Planctomycetota bacterium]
MADYVSAVLDDGPIGYWRLNETAGNTAANIGSLGNAAEGTYVSVVDQNDAGPPAAPGLGVGNTAMGVGPGDGSVQTGQSILSNLSAFTMSAFIKPADRAADRIGLFGQNDAIEFGFINPDTVQIWTPGGGSLNVTYPFPADEWHHIATVGNGTNLTVYFDGQPAGTGGGVTGNYGSSGFGFNIGGGGVYDGTGNQFTGSIDEVAVFDKALTENQILAHIAASQEPIIPEPSTLVLAALGLLGIIGMRRRRR